jgi:D-serine deaminase-like pyridoxal phosphate-dependent protein
MADGRLGALEKAAVFRSNAMSPAEQFAQSLIGQQGSRWRLPTPALVVDLDRLEANIARQAARAKAAGLALRPHAKTHKSGFIAKAQIAAGAVGACCAKPGEAEALAAAGVSGLLITSPIASADVAERCAALTRLDPALMVVVDNPIGARALQDACEAASATIGVVIDVDVGMGRTGVAGVEAAVALADEIANSPRLRFAGVQGYGGSWQHIAGENVRLAAVQTGMARLSAVVEALRAGGHNCRLITGGGTGTVSADAAVGVLNELQCGSYVFMDNQYADALGADDDGAFETSLFVQSRVISANAPAWVTIDAGLKAFATDGPPPRPLTAPFSGQAYFYFGDEHGGLPRPAGGAVTLGDRVELMVPHCDPTVDRYSAYHLVRGDTLVAIEPIQAARQSR